MRSHLHRKAYRLIQLDHHIQTPPVPIRKLRENPIEMLSYLTDYIITYSVLFVNRVYNIYLFLKRFLVYITFYFSFNSEPFYCVFFNVDTRGYIHDSKPVHSCFVNELHIAQNTYLQQMYIIAAFNFGRCIMKHSNNRLLKLHCEMLHTDDADIFEKSVG